MLQNPKHRDAWYNGYDCFNSENRDFADPEVAKNHLSKLKKLLDD